MREISVLLSRTRHGFKIATQVHQHVREYLAIGPDRGLPPAILITSYINASNARVWHTFQDPLQDD
jgi:hypothetical protein